ncbi:MAG: NusG domain II-containing protein, partial [Thermodesulfovibrionales bacterium]|nr:NusG domain II-containing protein [Thermodesulfovibrionales bacterium]
TLADILLLAALIIISISGFIFIKKAFPQGTDVKIEVNGKLAYKLPLNSDATIAVKGIIGDTIVEIKNRKVRIKESPCPNKICVHIGWIDRGAVICLPNRVTVFIDSSEVRENKAIDAITG